MEKYGYIRVSTREQNPERQFIAMKDCGIRQENIFLDKLSGKDFSRPQYRKLLKKLKKGDLLIVKSIDMPLLNTNVGHGDLTGVFIADLVLQILAYVAETDIIKM